MAPLAGFRPSVVVKTEQRPAMVDLAVFAAEEWTCEWSPEEPRRGAVGGMCRQPAEYVLGEQS